MDQMEASNFTVAFDTDEGTTPLVTNASYLTLGADEARDMRNLFFGLVGAVINLFGLVFLVLSKKIKLCLKISLINLASNDLLMMIIVGAIGNVTGKLKSQDSWCWGPLIILFTTFMVSYETILFLAIQNFIAVFYPLRCNAIMNNLRTAVSIVFIWIFGFFVSLFSMGVNPIKDKDCYPIGLISTPGIVCISALCILCTIVVAAINLMIVLKVRSVRRVFHGIPAGTGPGAKRLSIPFIITSPTHHQTHTESDNIAATSQMAQDIDIRSDFTSPRTHSSKADDNYASDYFTESSTQETAVASHLSLRRKFKSTWEILKKKENYGLKKECTISSASHKFAFKRSMTCPCFSRSLIKARETGRDIAVSRNAHNSSPKFSGKGKEGPAVRAKNSKGKYSSLKNQGYSETNDQREYLEQSSNYRCLTHCAKRVPEDHNDELEIYPKQHLCKKSMDIMTLESLGICVKPKQRDWSYSDRVTAKPRPQSSQRKLSSEGHELSNDSEGLELQNNLSRGSSVSKSSNTNLGMLMENFTLNRSDSLVPRGGPPQINIIRAGAKKTRNTLMILTLYSCFFTLPYVGYGFYVATLIERDRFALTRLGMILSSFLLFNAILNPFFYAWRFVEWRHLCSTFKTKITRIR